MNRIEIEAMMKANPNDLMLWDGRVMTVAEALGRVLKGDGVEVTPAAPAPGQPGHQAGPNIRISQEAVNNLTQAQYDELSRTGYLQGVTNSDNGRAVVRVSQEARSRSSAHSTRRPAPLRQAGASTCGTSTIRRRGRDARHAHYRRIR